MAACPWCDVVCFGFTMLYSFGWGQNSAQKDSNIEGNYCEIIPGLQEISGPSVSIKTCSVGHICFSGTMHLLGRKIEKNIETLWNIRHQVTKYLFYKILPNLEGLNAASPPAQTYASSMHCSIGPAITRLRLGCSLCCSWSGCYHSSREDRLLGGLSLCQETRRTVEMRAFVRAPVYFAIVLYPTPIPLEQRFFWNERNMKKRELEKERVSAIPENSHGCVSGVSTLRIRGW